MPADHLAAGVRARDIRSVARAISVVERETPDGADLIRRLYPFTGRASIVGITGPPGAGKSTLVDRLVVEIRAAGLSVGVLAVDPSSPFSGGALLGDRVRMGTHASDAGVFIRSMATRGHLGGLARATGDAALILDAAGFDIVIIETVGVGQDEVDVAATADVSVVTLVPGTGDEVQAQKAGVMEIADLFAVNKADHPGADRLVEAVAASQALQPFEAGAWRPPILKTIATDGVGVGELWRAIRQFLARGDAARLYRTTLRAAKALREAVAGRLRQRVDAAVAPAEFAALVAAIVARDQDPYGAADAIVARLPSGDVSGAVSQPIEVGPVSATLAPRSFDWGDLRLTTLSDGTFLLDGGAMFGVVPRTLWARRAAPDDRNRILLSMRPLVVEGAFGRLMIDCGAGDKWSAKERHIYGFERTRHLDHALAEAGLSADDIDLVLATHLHFDHFGGATMRDGGRLVPRFPRARYLIRSAEWEDATHPHERNRASYLPDDFVPLRDAGVVEFYEGDQTIRPGVRVVRTGGHTGQHQIVFVESRGLTAVFTADLIPTTAHIQDAWVMGYDLFPMETLAFKRQFIREAIDRGYLIFFEHDPFVPAGYIRERDGRRYVEPVA